MKTRPGRLDFYVFKELTLSATVGSLVAIVVLLGLQALRLSEFIIKYSLEREIIFRMLFGMGVSFLPLVVPIACLFALLGVFGRMSTDREFVAAQSMGFSPMRILRPCLLFGVLSSLASIWFSFSVGPAGNRGFEATIDEAFKRRVASALRPGAFNEGFLDLVLFVDDIDPVSQELKRVFLHDAMNFKKEVSVSSKRGRWIEPSEQEPVGTLKLMDGVVVSRDIERLTVRRIKFDEYRIYADFSSQAGRSKDSPPSLSWGSLMERRKLDPKLNRILPMWIEIARRFSVSFTCLIFIPLAFALSIDNRRTAKSRAVMTGLLILFAYWTIYFALVTWLLKSSTDFVQHTEWFTWAMIWLPNFVLILLGGGLFYKKRTGMSH